MILSETLLFIVSMLITGVILFLLVYFIITLSDLECDYINAQQCCSRLNSWVIPKLIGQALVMLLFLLHGFFWLFFVNLPVTAWSAYELWRVPSGNVGVYDPTEIHNRGQLKIHMRDVLINVGFHLVAFFVYLYCFSYINDLTRDDPPELINIETTQCPEFDAVIGSWIMGIVKMYLLISLILAITACSVGIGKELPQLEDEFKIGSVGPVGRFNV